MKMMRSYLEIAYEKPFSPSPRLRGEGAGGEGPNCLETLPPHPGPLPRKAGGGGGNTRVNLQTFKTLLTLKPENNVSSTPHPLALAFLCWALPHSFHSRRSIKLRKPCFLSH